MAVMEIGLTVPALLFPAISLLYLSYNGRFLALASLIRSLHREQMEREDRMLQEQIDNLRERLELIRKMQICGAASFLMAAASMTFLFMQMDTFGNMSFGASLLLLLASVGFLLRENIISVRALGILLDSATPRSSDRP